MNGFMTRLRRWTVCLSLSVAAGSVLADETFEPAEFDTSSMAAAGCESCSASASDSCESCSAHHGHKQKYTLAQRMKDKWRAFDKEQLHPDHCWPEQYSREAQRRIYAPLGAQLVAGQRLEATIWEHYFDLDNPGQLNESGRSRLRYMARKRPYVIPQLELQSAFDPEIDQQRVATVTEFIQSVSTTPVAWNVIVVNRGTPMGLFGQEGPKSIDKMIGIGGNPPKYEPQIKQGFFRAGDDE
jgi:hypothetical protein